MNKAQKQLLKEELQKLEKDKKSGVKFQIFCGIVIALLLFIVWPIALLIFAFVAIYYAITIPKINHRINDLKFKLAGEKKK